MIGFFVNTLALRSEVDSNLSFRSFLSTVRQTTLDGYDHQLAPFEKVVDRVEERRDMSRSPLFQVMLVLQNTPEDQGIEMGAVNVTPYDQSHTTSRFDLTFNLSESPEGLNLMVEYSTDLFDRSTIERIVVHYKTLLESIVEDPEQIIGNLNMLTKAEAQLLLDFNDTAVDYPKDKTIIDLFEEQVTKTPDHIALVYEGEELTYKELDERSNQLGRYLKKKGVEPDMFVGICIDRSLEMIVGILGVLKSGGAYVPIDSEHPKERINYMLEDASINLVLISTAVESVLEDNEGLNIVLLDRVWEQISKESIAPIELSLLPSNLAYVIYTSGSTGKPKGVMVSHRNVVRLFKHEGCLFDFRSTDVWTLFHSFSFDFSVWEIFGSLFYGGRLVIVPRSVTLDTVLYSKLIKEQGVTVLNQTPSSFYVLQESLLLDVSALELRYVIFGGEALSLSRLGMWSRSFETCKLINMYGITETTVHVTYKEISSLDIDRGISNIGKVLPTLSSYILNDQENLQPIGVIGELCIGGEGLARGYLNREELTKAKFVSNPSKDSRLSY